MRFLTKRIPILTAAVAGVVVLGLGVPTIASAGSRGGEGQNPSPATPSLYNSMAVSSNYVWSFAFDATGANQFGNDVTLVNGGGRLGSVVVSMANFNPASSSAPLPITLTIYNPSASEPGNGVAPGSVIATDTVTITPPGTATGSTFPNNPPSYGIQNFNVTFNFQSQKISLPAEVVYKIAYNNTTVDTGLNVNLSYESSSVPSVGADTYPGYLFVATANGSNGATGGPSGEITCQGVSNAFEQYSTAPAVYGSTDCGLAASPVGPGLLVPAVQFTSSSR
jgi:hypothetical protein